MYTVFIVYVWLFFFKQKTAYEMRISDWSSDVCSSDLYPMRRRAGKYSLIHCHTKRLMAPLRICQRYRTGTIVIAIKISGKRPQPQPLRKVLKYRRARSEERRVGQELVIKGRARWSPYH